MKNVLELAALITGLVLAGTAGFMLIEGWSFLDALYMSMITITTVGYNEVQPLSDGGRVFVMAYLICSLGFFFYGVVQIGEQVIRAELGYWWEKRKMQKTIKGLSGHYIICGAGRMGRVLAHQLAARGRPFVVVDRDPERIERCSREGWLVMAGDATDDGALRDAGVETARGLASALPNDADNVYVVLSARLLSSSLQIISRASDEKVVTKLERAGANRVVSLYSTAASKMAHFLVNPHVDQFLEVIGAEGTELDIAEIEIDEGSPYSGRTLAETDFTRRGIIIVGIRRRDGELLLPPPGSAVIGAADHLIALGKADVIEELTGHA